jgi:membrane-bound metal-dependent hydrolase YbcI (DUF457 family)
VDIAPGDTAFTPLAFVHYPYSHSLLLTLVWAALFGGLYWAVRRNPSGALWIGLAVLSHWALDAISHRPDLPLYPDGDARVGLGLWNSVAGTVLVEGLLFAAALALYLRCTRARDRTGTLALWVFVVVLLLPYVAGIFGPPPPNAEAVAIADIAGGGLAVAWGYWIDRHRIMAES